MAFQNNVFPIIRAYPGGFAGGPFYPSHAGIIDVGINAPCIFGNFCWFSPGGYNITGTNYQSSVQLAGLVLASSQGVSYDANVIYPGNPITSISPGQICEFAVRGSYFVIIAYTGSGNIDRFSPIWARNTDGAIALGITNESGYVKTNFVNMDIAAITAVGALIKISNTEEVIA